MQELLLIGRLFYLESASRESSSTSGVVNVRRAAAVINKIDFWITRMENFMPSLLLLVLAIRKKEI